MDSRKLRIGVIGLGGVSRAHLQAVEDHDVATVISVCDVDDARVREAAARFGAAAFSNYRDLLYGGDIDLALVLTPASTHREIVEAGAEAGVHILCEKPMAVSLEDARSMVAACASAGVKLFYGSCYRYLPAMRAARSLIASGTIGRVQLLTEQLVGGNGYDRYRELTSIHYPLGGPGGPGMGLVDHGIHLIDTFPWLIGSDIEAAWGRGLRSGSAADTEYLMMRFRSGAIGSLLYNAATFSTQLPTEGVFSGGQGWQADSSITAPGRWDAHPGSISVYGTDGALRIFHYANALYLADADGVRKVDCAGRPAFGHFATQLEACAKSIFEDSAPDVDGDDGLRALEVLLRAYGPDTEGRSEGRSW
ncbi:MULTISPECIES: Gfo/Idh/MocA family protein [Kordiimonas]|uniref:Gfo/Idh/MocA family protein n=1 Tax=Kordiimonas TaxID=288021 RepID=UPI0025799B09|nr:Gfo/Idh/MocA family oxidoreductase [Kordiimonas sp. UBA4487]